MQLAALTNPASSKRQLIQIALIGTLGLLPLCDQVSAEPLTLADVTPVSTSAGPLPKREADIVDIFSRTTNSVVNIIDVTLQGRGSGGPEADVPEGNGTGFVWDKAGHIVTNWHVLQASLGPARDTSATIGRRVATVAIQSAAGKQQSFPATLVGADKLRDLAVLLVQAPPELLEPVQLGASSRLRVGQQCLAIGNPFGFDHTLTAGVISGVDRDIRSQITGMVIPGGIQTDAAINPGNSGGPLLDSNGKVIGVNTQIFTATGTSAGLGFALPIDMVKTVVPQLIATGKVLQPSLNVQFAAESVAQKLGVRSGLLIQAVQPDGAAAKAGLLATRRALSGIVPGDSILAIDGVSVRNNGDVLELLGGHQVGDRVEVKVARFGDSQGPHEITVSVVLEEDK